MLAFTVYDVIVTTLHRGGGPVTRMLTQPVWRLMLRARYGSPTYHRLVGYAGLGLVLFTVLLWITLLWLGWTLTFMGDPRAVLRSEDHVPADLVERVYFTGFTIFTLGIGDFIPGRPLYQLLTTVASLSGFFVVTFALTYLIPVAQAGAAKRALADSISTLGKTPAAILVHAWNGDRLAALEDSLSDVIQGLAESRQAFLTYPVLHFFHSSEPEQSMAVTVARLDEALWVAEAGTDQELIHKGLAGRWHAMVERLYDTLEIAREDELEVPPIPRLSRARAAGIPLVDDETIAERLRTAAPARRRTLELVRAHGWSWDEVGRGHSGPKPLGRRHLLTPSPTTDAHTR